MKAHAVRVPPRTLEVAPSWASIPERARTCQVTLEEYLDGAEL
jgi:hypothetical protein